MMIRFPLIPINRGDWSLANNKKDPIIFKFQKRKKKFSKAFNFLSAFLDTCFQLFFKLFSTTLQLNFSFTLLEPNTSSFY